MSLWQETRQSVRGLWRLVRFDPDAADAFNCTIDGYWRSFFAALLVLPLYLILWMSFGAPAEPGAAATGDPAAQAAVTAGRRLLVEAINYPLAWTLWPLVVFYVARAAGWGERYIGYIVVFNWAQLLTQGLVLAVVIVLFPGMPPAARSSLLVFMLILSLAFEAAIAKRMLDVTWLQAGMVEAIYYFVTEVQGAVKSFVLQPG